MQVDTLSFSPALALSKVRTQMQALKMGAQGVRLSWQTPSALWREGCLIQACGG